MNKLFFLLLVISQFNSFAQERQYQFTVIGGAAIPVGFKNVKQPGYTIKLWAEKQINEDEADPAFRSFEVNSAMTPSTPSRLVPDIKPINNITQGLAIYSNRACFCTLTLSSCARIALVNSAICFFSSAETLAVSGSSLPKGSAGTPSIRNS